MELTTEQLKRCDLVKVAGRIDGQTAPQLAEGFNTITEAGRFKIVFDMSDVDFISSAGLRVLIDVQKTCKRWNRGQLVLATVPERIYETLDLTGFVPLFNLFDDVLHATDGGIELTSNLKDSHSSLTLSACALPSPCTLGLADGLE